MVIGLVIALVALAAGWFWHRRYMSRWQHKMQDLPKRKEIGGHPHRRSLAPISLNPTTIAIGDIASNKGHNTPKQRLQEGIAAPKQVKHMGQIQVIPGTSNATTTPSTASIEKENGQQSYSKVDVPRSFPYEELSQATGNFNENRKLGEGASGAVYEGTLAGIDTSVAIKRIKETSSDQTKKAFVNEIKIMSQLHHRNILSLKGWCEEDKHLLLIYEIMENGSLEDHLYPENGAMDTAVYGETDNDARPASHLSWLVRHNIIIGIASGLAYLHKECRVVIVHRDLKPANVMLDRNWNAKLVDFGLVTQLSHTQTSRNMDNIRGTRAYIDPAYLESGKVSEQCDVYSLGVVLLEIVCGTKPSILQSSDKHSLIEMVQDCDRSNRILDAADKGLRGQFDKKIEAVLRLGLQCVLPDHHNRPHAGRVRDRLMELLENGKVAFSTPQPSEEQFGTRTVTPVPAASLPAGWFWRGRHKSQRKHKTQEKENGQQSYSEVNVPRHFTYEELAQATSNFNEYRKLGEGAFGAVYGGTLAGIDRTVAIKKIRETTSNQTKMAFHNEIKIMRQMHHRNILSLKGWCEEDKHLLVIYEMTENGSLEDLLYPKNGAMDTAVHFGTYNNTRPSSPLSWLTRRNILIGIASGLAYLHNECPAAIVHRDLKPANVMLDRNWNAKLADFGLVTQVRHTETSRFTDNVIGTRSYIDPAYMDTGKVSGQCDVYSLGVVLLETICGEKPIILQGGNKNSLIEKVRECDDNNRILDAADKGLKGQFDKEIKAALRLGLQCVSPDNRPHAGRVRDRLTKLLEYGNTSEETKEASTVNLEALSRRCILQGEGSIMATQTYGFDEAPQSAGSMLSSSSRDNDMASKLQNTTCLTIRVLQEITDNFSEKRKIGQGACGKVYRAELQNGKEIAVKVLYNNVVMIDDVQFQREFENLMRLEHHNIVRLVGYCYETQHQPIQHMGGIVFAEMTYKALCFEYMQNGSLEEHLSDEGDGLEWHTCYNIIKGAWKGLQYLHKGSDKPIYHLDLKPGNILLDKNMVPKLADFGLSKLMGDQQSIITKTLMGTIGYMPKEYFIGNIVSNKFDIFSLGVVMIKIIAGREGHSKSVDMSRRKFLDLVQRNWRDKMQETCLARRLLEAYCKQVNVCTEIALSCMDTDRHKRPNIVDIIHQLNGTEAVIDRVRSDALTRSEVALGHDTTRASRRGGGDAAHRLGTAWGWRWREQRKL
ncbi:receptor like protein kinase S.2-like isoform X3 [Hordeum vulgare subsp. vulgare]|uniref:receptor like protein kinase S.2-like isoform X3 n=1 Tax=Hordeum vulgare subsp. vulgare TaxID=112509 RepID=UPI001D1A3402|nr:receptor like protein kinase S.2-like isoform X3 [Hordeum vulgare subsp. vulgare]XP_044952486.1 receptor like protein kinase S.2-like isoform X3 [Hordeum vulgare subsp. vulgare]